MRQFIVKTTQISILTAASTSEQAVRQVLDFERAPDSAFVAVYVQDPTPKVSAHMGSPMGRRSDTLSPKGHMRARKLRLDAGGYDRGGAYWGLRKPGESLYAVQDGMGNVAFVDATDHKMAKAIAIESHA